ncbi:hypothetical protein [Bradyrhizobium sp. USDA 4011]
MIDPARPLVAVADTAGAAAVVRIGRRACARLIDLGQQAVGQALDGGEIRHQLLAARVIDVLDGIFQLHQRGLRREQHRPPRPDDTVLVERCRQSWIVVVSGCAGCTRCSSAAGRTGVTG